MHRSDQVAEPGPNLERILDVRAYFYNVAADGHPAPEGPMESEPTTYLCEFSANAGAGDGELKAAQVSLNFVLPEDYRAFMKARNGGEGFVGENYIIVWKLEELAAVSYTHLTLPTIYSV